MTERVEVLRDGRGVYGLAVPSDPNLRLVVRPDKVEKVRSSWPPTAALQKITGGFRHSMFKRTVEEGLRQHIHHGMLNRAGLSWPPRQSIDEHGVSAANWWSDNPKQAARNRAHYHGLRLSSLAIVNKLIARTLEEAADPEALRTARRYRLEHRLAIYTTAASSSLRVRQLCEVFPTAAVLAFGKGSFDQRQDVCNAVEAGAPLKRIAGMCGLPLAVRHVKPGAVGVVVAVAAAIDDERVIEAYLPDTLRSQRRWLRAVHSVCRTGSEFARWTAKWAMQIEAASDLQVERELTDLADWVTASYRASVPRHVVQALSLPFTEDKGERFVTRRFSPDMSLATVRQLSHDWHEAVAANMTGKDSALHAWCTGTKVGSFDILPITTTGDLYLEGRTMHHCAGTLAEDARRGDSGFFSIRHEGKRVATLQTVRTDTGVGIGQLRGPCNAAVERPVTAAVRTWMSRQSFDPPARPPFHPSISRWETTFGDDGEIPF